MDHRSFDALARSLAGAKTRRGFLAGLGAVLVGGRAASAQSACPPGQTPNRKGDCSCPAGTDACPNGCFDLKRDTANSGGCGRSCAGGECRKGECRCPVGTVLCYGVCRSQPSFIDDPNNCGGCGVSCDDGNACTTDTCSGGVCHNSPNADACTTSGGAAGTCSGETCVANTTTTTTTTAPTTTTTTTTTTTMCIPKGQPCLSECGRDQCCDACCSYGEHPECAGVGGGFCHYIGESDPIC